MGAAIGQPDDAAHVVPPGSRPCARAKDVARWFAALPSWRSIVAVAFTIGAMMNLAWLVLGAIQAVCLRRSARVATPRLEPLLARVAADPHHLPRVCLSARIGLPARHRRWFGR